MSEHSTTETRESTSPPWSRRRQEVGVIIWSSFLAACLATMIFFAFFDPMQLGEDNWPPAWLTSRMAGYALGFFFFWFVTAVSAMLTSYLLETLPAAGRPGKDPTASERKS